MSKAAQQKLHYALYGQVGNLFNEKVFTMTGVKQSLVPERLERPDGHVSYFELEPIACDVSDDAF